MSTGWLDIDHGQHWLRLWLAAWRHQAITRTNVDFPLVSALRWHSPESNSTVSTKTLYNEFDSYDFRVTGARHVLQWPMSWWTNLWVDHSWWMYAIYMAVYLSYFICAEIISPFLAAKPRRIWVRVSVTIISKIEKHVRYIYSFGHDIYDVMFISISKLYR